MKTIITHLNPDLDAITSTWLLIRFGGEEFSDAQIKFLPAGETYENQPVDSNKNVIHVDTALGRFDHHQTSKKTCAARLVYQWLMSQNTKIANDQALQRMVSTVEEIDFDAADLGYPQADHDRYAFLFNERQIIGGWYRKYKGQSDKIMELGLEVLDGVYQGLKSKIISQNVFQKAQEFKTKWGRGIGAETQERGFMPLAFAKGYTIAVSKDPQGGNVRIKGWSKNNTSKINLTQVYKILKKRDPHADWFFHASRKMLLNGSRVNPKMKPSRLSLNQVIEIIKNTES